MVGPSIMQLHEDLFTSYKSEVFSIVRTWNLGTSKIVGIGDTMLILDVKKFSEIQGIF